jgi:hypothetical protein
LVLAGDKVFNSYPGIAENQMKATQEKIEDLFPSVYITLISILFGFAVEDVITRLRELAPLDMYTLLSAVGVLSGIMAAWIGYSFVSMTQERLPRIMDAVHVFLMAFCFYIVITTLGMDIWWFFAALSVYQCVALYATIYNGNILIQGLSARYDWRVFLPNRLIVAIGIGIYSVGAWMSREGMLSPEIELSLVVYYFISNILWVYFFYGAWTRLIKEFA